MPTLSDIRKDAILNLADIPHRVIAAQHTKIGRGGAMVRTKLRRLTDGAVLSKTFKGADKIKLISLTHKDMQYLYQTSDKIHLMDGQTYEQSAIGKAMAAGQVEYLEAGAKVVALFFNNQIVSLELPKKTIVKVINTEPGVRGDTSGSATKRAEIGSGRTIHVPLFIKAGDRIIVDTASGEYLERAK